MRSSFPSIPGSITGSNGPQIPLVVPLNDQIIVDITVVRGLNLYDKWIYEQEAISYFVINLFFFEMYGYNASCATGYVDLVEIWNT